MTAVVRAESSYFTATIEAITPLAATAAIIDMRMLYALMCPTDSRRPRIERLVK